MKKVINVVAAVIKKDKLIFVSQRGYGEFKDGWEFPGGKVNDGETEEKALKREIKEELDADIEIDKFICSVEYEYPNFFLNMKVYLTHLNKPHLELLEHEASKWINKDELDEIPFLPADKLCLNKIKEAIKD